MISESTAHVPFRLFSPPDVQAGAAVALGRNHASWFLVLARPEELCPSRPIFCLNFALPDDRSAFNARSAGGKHVFAVGGAMSDDIMDHLTALLDQEGCAPVNVVEVYPNNPFYLRALVEVLVPDRELMYACARCGKWETQLGPRFMRCGGCRRMCYCSTKCQKADWKPAYHKGECALLREGKGYEVECRRKLHNNGWWFENGALGVQTFLAGTGEYDWVRAHITGDWHYLAYGNYTPPHDVPPDTQSRPTFSREAIASMPPAAPPPGFISTGNRARDHMLIKRFRTTVLRTDPALPSSVDTFHTPGVTRNTVPEHDIPVFPPLPVPQTPGFVFTGDVILDQWLLEAYLKEFGTQAERDAVEEVWQQRLVCLDAREDLYEEVSWRSEEYKKMMMVHLGAIVQNARATQRAAETHGQDDEELARMCMEGVWAGGCECDSRGDLSQVRKGDKEKLQPAWRSRISLP